MLLIYNNINNNNNDNNNNNVDKIIIITIYRFSSISWGSMLLQTIDI